VPTAHVIARLVTSPAGSLPRGSILARFRAGRWISSFDGNVGSRAGSARSVPTTAFVLSCLYPRPPRPLMRLSCSIASASFLLSWASRHTLAADGATENPLHGVHLK